MKIDLVFLTLAAVCLMCGVSMGMWMGMNHDFSMAPVHAHFNLVGWASLALYGLTYRAYPQLQKSWMAKAHLVLSGISGPLFPFGIYMAMVHDDATYTRIGAPMWFLGALIFLISLVRMFFAKEKALA
jgi:hypothetical protein